MKMENWNDMQLPFDSLVSLDSSSNEMFPQSVAISGTEHPNCFLSNSNVNFENINMSALPSNFQYQSMDVEWPAMLPTPPRSPDSSQVCEGEDVAIELKDSVLDELELINADALDILEDMGLEYGNIVDDIINSNWIAADSDAGLSSGSSELRHDCMWSGTCYDSCKQRTRYPSENSDIGNLLTPAQSPLRNCCAPSDELKVNQSVNEFVDPSAVMSYTPHADHSYYLTDAEKAAEDPITTVSTPMPSAKKSKSAVRKVISDSDEESSDASSNNEDDDDDDEDDEDEEEYIDVVSVHAPLAGNGQMRAHQRSLTSHATSSQRSLLKSKNSLKTAAHKQRKQRSSASAPASPYLPSVTSPVPSSNPASVEYPMPKVTSSGRIVQPTNRSASFLEAQPQVSARGDHHRRRKRNDQPSGRHTKHNRTHAASSRCSDAEDPEKRREHNSMERKRRDDLRSNFQKLRQLIPSLVNNSKAAKVIILNQAADYTRTLLKESKRLESEASLERRRQKRLTKKLRSLERDISSSQFNCSIVNAHAVPV